MLAPTQYSCPVTGSDNWQNASLLSQSEMIAHPEGSIYLERYGITCVKNFKGEYVLIPRPPGVVIGEKILRPIIDWCCNFFQSCANFSYTISPFSILPSLENKKAQFWEKYENIANISSVCPKESESLSIFKYATYFGIFDDAYIATMKISTKIPWYMANRIYVAFVTINDQGNLTVTNETSGERIKSLIPMAKQKNPNAEFFVVSNYGSDTIDQNYLKAAKNPQKFAMSVLEFLKDYGLDGYDMDWETNLINDYAKELHSLLKACYDLFQTENAKGHHYKVTHAVLPGIHSAETVALLADAVDGINIMSYRMDIDRLKSLVEEYGEKGFPYKKMLVGMESEMNSESYDSIVQKVEFIKKYKLGGGYTWRFDNDSRDYNDPWSRTGPSTFRRAAWLYDAFHKD